MRYRAVYSPSSEPYESVIFVAPCLDPNIFIVRIYIVDVAVLRQAQKLLVELAVYSAGIVIVRRIAAAESNERLRPTEADLIRRRTR